MYGWIGQTLDEHRYARQGRESKGLVRSYVRKMTGLSRAQATRLIGQHARTGEVQEAGYRRHRFPTRCSKIDAALLAAVDEAHDTLSGPATRKILEREFAEFGKQDYVRLAGISVAQLYRLRHSKSDRTHFTKTKPTAVSRTGRPSRISARTHGASRRSEWRQGRVSHQRGRRTHAVGNRGLRAAD